MNQLEPEQKTSEELKKLRENSKILEVLLEESIGGLDLGQAIELKGELENLKKKMTYEASESFYAGNSSNSPFGVDGGINIDPNLNPFEKRRMVNVNALNDHNMVLPNHPSPFGNYVEEFVPGLKHNMALPSHPNPNESGNEHPHDGHPPQPRSD
ncbi:Agamous-like MADS-box protein AGL62 [Raphanus sativus]|nr:Agamous-like MADS-box protein AGL62 [Raphanus sativus]